MILVLVLTLAFLLPTLNFDCPQSSFIGGTSSISSLSLAGDPKRKGCRSLLGWGIINLSMEITEIINNKVG